MILINPKGGLASQLHKYFVAYAVAKKYDTKVKVLIKEDRNKKDRDFELDKLCIDLEYPTKFEKFFYLKIHKLKKKLGLNNKNLFFKKLMTYDYQKSLSNHTYIDGEWIIGDIYFSQVKNDIEKMFGLKGGFSKKVQETIEKIEKSNSISLHIRRGDYLNKKVSEFHGNLTLDYYKEAIDIIKNKVKNPEFFIFSDDMEWVKENLKIDFPTFYINYSSVEDILIMSKCKHNIIANSSYGYLASYFNSNKEKIIIGPKKWFVDDSLNKKVYEYIDTTSWISI